MRLVCLHSDEASIVIEHDAQGRALWRHCGVRMDVRDLPPLAEARGLASFAMDDDVALAVVPAAGLGWFGPAPLKVRSLTGEGVMFAPGNVDIPDTPDQIAITARDAVSGLDCTLTIDRIEGGAFRFGVQITNRGAAPVMIDAVASVQLPLPATAARIISWRGRHNAELAECAEPMPEHGWQRITRRGSSGHGGPPGVYVLDTDAGWHRGLVYALQLAWSGDSAIAIEHDDEGYWTLAAEALAAPGEIVLAPGETYQAPPAILAISTKGRNGAMQQQHTAVRSLLRWPGATMRPRPVHLNSWEACYFDHDVTRIERLARAAAAIGVERLVLDDGWFKGRRNDTAALGDWVADPDTYPDGLGPLAQAVEAMGMEFGLWVEPEMISPDSDLYRDHPDWALALPGRAQPTARHQLVIDMRKPEVRDHLFARLDAILSEAPIGYLKWDQNRDHAPSGGAGQTRGTYDLLAALRARHPAVEIEGCAGGGGRSDAGLAPYVHRFWTSDNIDAAARVAMQRGFLAFLPPEIMGSHIGASPAHATGRAQSMAFRAAVACMGHLGVELDPEALTEAEREELADWIAFYKRWRHVLHGARVDLGEGPDGLRWQAQGGAGEKLLFAIRTAPPQDRRPQPLRLPFAAASAGWNVSLLAVAQQHGHGIARASLFRRMKQEPVRFDGSWLAEAGLPMPVQKAESVAIFRLEATP